MQIGLMSFFKNKKKTGWPTCVLSLVRTSLAWSSVNFRNELGLIVFIIFKKNSPSVNAVHL
ncbi:hypothetical protein AB4323_18610, partial [Vibrio sp. 10N.261.52.C11]|uniref:hypothetical protein n=1 Tax=Vibrio sp. 10N.261.52.C11 TaxID=3229680 RepID=UPI003550B890